MRVCNSPRCSFERRASDRPAGIRTMGLVSLGGCFFTISSITAFKSSTMTWDASRVTAALPSGVGFLGAALIWKGSVGDGDDEVHQVHGLTTAARYVDMSFLFVLPYVSMFPYLHLVFRIMAVSGYLQLLESEPAEHFTSCLYIR